MKRFAILAAAALFCAAPAAAQVYVEGNIGGSFLEDSDFSGSVGGAPFTGTLEFDNAWVLGAAVGYRFTPNIRAEFNLSYRNADVEGGTLSGTPFDGAGDMGALAGMVNVYYDITTGTAFKPYVGAGVGLARLELNSDSNADVVSDDEDLVFAWNLMAGVAYTVARNVDVTLGYRYIATQDASFDVTVPSLAASGSMDAEFGAHEVMLGVRYSF